MVIAGIVLVILALIGIARTITLPLGVLLVLIGIAWDLLYFAGHTVALIF